MNKIDILTLTVAGLKNKLSELNLSTTGRKQTLQDRLLEYHGLEEIIEEECDTESIGNETVYEETSSGNSHSTFTLRDIQESVNYFDGTGQPEIEVWINEFEENAFCVKWNDLQKFIYGKQLIKGAALAFIKSQSISTWLGLKNSLTQEFGKTLSAIEVHKTLERRKKKPNESFLEYLYSLILIAKTAKIDEESIVDYFIQGINDNRYAKSILYEATSINELKIKINAYEKINRKTSSSLEINNEQDKTYHKECLNCPYLNNHLTSDCRKSNGLCFKCNQKGHKAADCRANLEANSSCNNKNSQNRPNLNNNASNNYYRNPSNNDA